MKTISNQIENPKGLHQRYFIQKIIFREGKFELKNVDIDAEYFVLRLDKNDKDTKHIGACRKAVLNYAENIKDHFPELAKDLIERYGNY
ncbi:MAG: hypothetical protein KGD57_07260 [Candidatus Lokiarchaeota archaeon]|nr:hypothetical protein [Candidatus Lokiarchaeota archaeon]